MDDIAIKAPGVARSEEILTPEALRFLAALHRRFDNRRLALLEQRRVRQIDFDRGLLPDFPAETADIRAAAWKVAPIPADLLDRRAEITGPVDRKMMAAWTSPIPPQARPSGRREFGGRGAVPLYNLMENAAMAEISRAPTRQ